MKLRRTAVVPAAIVLSLLSVTPASAGAPATGGCPATFTETDQEEIDTYIAETYGLDLSDEDVQAGLDAAFAFIDQNGDGFVCWDKRPGRRGTIVENRSQRP